MSLIKCPECGKEISDKSVQCIHCGYPLSYDNYTKETEDKFKFAKELVKNGSKVKAIKEVSNITGMDLQESLKFIENNFNDIPNNRPKCPTCGSMNIQKISVGSKVVGGAMFGLFSSNVRKTMHCKNCGYKW